jgi:hypothetical protein
VRVAARPSTCAAQLFVVLGGDEDRPRLLAFGQNEMFGHRVQHERSPGAACAVAWVGSRSSRLTRSFIPPLSSLLGAPTSWSAAFGGSSLARPSVADGLIDCGSASAASTTNLAIGDRTARSHSSFDDALDAW